MIGGRGFPGRQVNNVGPVEVVLSGLSSNAVYFDFAQIGSQISLTANGVAPDVINFGSTPGGSEYGTTLPLSVPGNDDSGDPSSPVQLHYSGTIGNAPFAGSLPIRAALPTVTTETSFAEQGSEYNQTSTLVPAAFSGLPAVFTRTASMFSPDELLASGDGSANLFHVTTVNEDNELIDGATVLICSGGEVRSTADNSFTVADFVDPAVADNLVISGQLNVGQVLTATGGTVTGNPTPTETWQWYRGTAAIAGATSALYTPIADDIGFSLRVRKTAATAGQGSAFDEALTSGTISAANVATISITGFEEQASDGNIDMYYTSDADDPTAQMMMRRSTVAKSVPSQYGQSLSGPDYYDLGQVSITIVGTQFMVTGPDGLRWDGLDGRPLGVVDILPTGGVANDVSSSPTFSVDSLSAILSPATFSAGASGGEVSWSFEPDEDGDCQVSIYDAGATPSDPDLAAGVGSIATFAVLGAVGGATSSGTLTGAANTLYDAYFWFDDGKGNQTKVGPVAVTSQSAGSTTITAPAVQQLSTNTPNEQTFNFTLPPTATQVAVQITAITNSSSRDLNIPPINIGGIVSAVPVSEVNENRSNILNFIESPDLSGGTLPVTVKPYPDAADFFAIIVQVAAIEGGTFLALASGFIDAGDGNGDDVILTEDVLAGDFIFGVGSQHSGDEQAFWEGLAQDPIYNAPFGVSFQTLAVRQQISADQVQRYMALNATDRTAAATIVGRPA